MKNLAVHQPSEESIVAVTIQARSELEAAGINVSAESDIFRSRSEVPSRVVGHLGPWGFKRAWYYWVAEGPGIPPDIATELHEKYGKEVRVDGHCGCPSPSEWFKGFAVGRYHIDTQVGLNALADVIRNIMAKHEKRRSEPG